MARFAIFVDAGYLFAQGAIALTGSKKPRSSCKLDENVAVALLTALGRERTDNRELLRIYWYDGALSFAGPTAEQIALANLENIKLRLGFVNAQGQQKGVDSIIVTDIIDLARNQAISDAVLMSGDEDVRIGVQIAQNFGVRVHLLGITPSRESQSRTLLQEADTTTEWDRVTVERFLSISPSIPMPASSPGLGTKIESTSILAQEIVFDPRIESVIGEIIEALDQTDVSRLQEVFTNQRTVPPEFDCRLLATSRSVIGRDLTIVEKRESRRRFIAAICLKA
jgi:uncharacterized LabA/DUF88 family protein